MIENFVHAEWILKAPLFSFCVEHTASLTAARHNLSRKRKPPASILMDSLAQYKKLKVCSVLFRNPKSLLLRKHRAANCFSVLCLFSLPLCGSLFFLPLGKILREILCFLVFLKFLYLLFKTKCK